MVAGRAEVHAAVYVHILLTVVLLLNLLLVPVVFHLDLDFDFAVAVLDLDLNLALVLAVAAVALLLLRLLRLRLLAATEKVAQQSEGSQRTHHAEAQSGCAHLQRIHRVKLLLLILRQGVATFRTTFLVASAAAGRHRYCAGHGVVALERNIDVGIGLLRTLGLAGATFSSAAVEHIGQTIQLAFQRLGHRVGAASVVHSIGGFAQRIGNLLIGSLVAMGVDVAADVEAEACVHVGHAVSRCVAAEAGECPPKPRCACVRRRRCGGSPLE